MNFPAQFRWVLWGALFIGIVLYFVILLVNSSGPEGSDTEFLKNLFYLLGLILLGSGQAVKYVANHTRTEEGKPRVPAWIDTAFIVALALTETVAIFGLVLGFMGAAVGAVLPLFAASVVGMVLLTPAAFYRVETIAGSGESS